MAAKTKFTPENRAVILATLRAGGTYAAACRDLNIRLKTAEGWLTRGRRESGDGQDTDYAEFAAAVDLARAEHDRAGMTADEFDRHLAKAVRTGSVQAMKLWWDIHGKGSWRGGETGGEEEPDAAEGKETSDDPFDDLEGEVVSIKAAGKKRK